MAVVAWCCVLLCLHIAQVAAGAPRFQGANYFQVDVGISGTVGTIVALGDLNDDKYTDLVVLAADNCLILKLWQHDEFMFVDSPVRICIPSDQDIWNVLLTDLDYDGILDLVVNTMERTQTDQHKASLLSSMCSVHGAELGITNDTPLYNVSCLPLLTGQDAATIQGQWTVLSLSGQLKSELFGSTTTGNGAIAYDSVTARYVRRNDAIPSACQIADVHSNAFVDVNGDCAADVIITCAPIFNSSGWLSTFEIWLAKPTASSLTFVKDKLVQIPARIGPVSFVDIDADGDPDFVYFLCDDQTPDSDCQWSHELHILLNSQMQLCVSSDETPCRLESDLCLADPDYQYSDDWVVKASDLVDDDNARFLLYVVWTGTQQQAWIPSRWADYNIDGFPDALVTIGFLHSDPSNSRAVLLHNVPCRTVAFCKGTPSSRTLFLDDDASDIITSANASSAFFFDLDEDGRVDVLAMVMTRDGLVKIMAFYNNIFEDAFFIKTLVLNGVCFENCGSSLKPVGVNEPGATVRFVVTATNGAKRLVQGSQLMQFCFGALATPFVLHGLGRTNAYIDEFAVGLPMQSDSYYHIWNGIIPNSQLFISPSLNEDDWLMELYISPSAYSGWVALSLVVTAVVLTLIVLLLHWFEMREDQRERRGALMLINFDAL